MTRQVFLKAMVTVVAVFGLLVFPSVLAAQGNSQQAFEHVKAVQEAHTDALMARTGVVGTAIGSGQGAQPVILVLLEYGGVAIPTSLEGVQVRPLVTGIIYALNKPPHDHNGGDDGEDPPPPDEPPLWRERPVPCGVSTGHPAITAGTLGCRVKSGATVWALTNNHVYANQNNASIGDAVIQPGAFDGGVSPQHDIGTLDDFERIEFSTNANNVIDAAIALTTTAQVDNAMPSGGYGVPRSETMDAALNQKVKKYGRTTGLTKGLVAGINATVTVNYGPPNGFARFVNQIIIQPGSFSAGGDSGSCVVVDGKGKDKANDRKPVGLLFAGSSLYTIANPIDAVLTRFGVTVDGN